MLALLPVGQVDHWWLCGPFEMVDRRPGSCCATGRAAAAIHQELFFVEDTPPEQIHHEDAAPGGATSEVTVVLDGRSTTVSLPQGRRPCWRVPSGCARTCRSRARAACAAPAEPRSAAGRCDMRRNFALEESEVEAGFVLTCQSVPLSDELTVNYDA